MKGTGFIKLSILLGFIGCLAGCSILKPPAEELKPLGKNSLDCDGPPQVGVLNKQELTLAGAKFREFSLGQIDYKSQPDLVELMTKIASNLLLVNYLICDSLRRGDIDQNDPVQVDHIRRFWAFMVSDPSPEQVSLWQKENPFPKQEFNQKSQIDRAENERIRLRHEHKVRRFDSGQSRSSIFKLSEVPPGAYAFTNGMRVGSQEMNTLEPDLLIFTLGEQLKENRNFPMFVPSLISTGIPGLTKQNITVKARCFGETDQTITNYTWNEIRGGYYEIGLSESLNATPGNPCLLWVEGTGDLENQILMKPIEVRAESIAYNVLYEIHKRLDGSTYVISFVNANTANQIRNVNRPENLWVTLFSDQWEKAQEIVAIPLPEIMSSKTPRGFEGRDMILLAWDVQLR